ncbi:MAG: metallophosphoesterase [Bacteroidetes bacterium]|nr:metallophosphoesterase [Bacteroidota bacterium]MCW5896506.1 metallophosphoesterase [Bacteroidota bacterium]
MERPFTIAHLSDLHISLDHSRHNIRKTRSLIEYCLRQGADHVVITGDITANGEKKEFEATRKIFRNYGLLDARKLSLLCGNHDVYGGVHRAEEILSFPKRCKTTNYDRKMREFREHFHEVFDSSEQSSPDISSPFVKVFDGVAIIGVHSIARYSRVKNPIGSNGEVDDKQFERLRKTLMAEHLKEKRKLVLIHHHFNKILSNGAGRAHSVWNAVERQTMKLRGKKRLLQLFAASSVDLVLHGHVHCNHEYMRKGIRFLNAGGSILGDNSTFHVAFIRVSPAGVQTTLRKLPQFAATQPTEPLLRPANQLVIPEAA